MNTVRTLTIALMFSLGMLLQNAALADITSNICKPDLDNPDVADTVMCTWPLDPNANPVPDNTACQAMIRTPTSPSDDCGNSDFIGCMQNLGFQCSETNTNQSS